MRDFLQFHLFCFSKQHFIILKNVGRIGGDAAKVKTRLGHILSVISKSVQFKIVEVRTKGTGSRPPIYEVILEDEDSAIELREAFKRFTRLRDPVSRPPELEGVQVFNSVTLATRVRVSILRVSPVFTFCPIFYLLIFLLSPVSLFRLCGPLVNFLFRMFLDSMI